MFGTDVDSALKVTMMTRLSAHEQFKPTELTLSQAVEENFQQTFDTISARMPNPIWQFLYKTTDKCYSFTEIEKVSSENSRLIREKIRGYVQKRASGECKSDLGGNSDVLSLMLESKDIFSEDDIIDELLDFLVAGTQTTQNTTQYALAHLMTDQKSLERVR